MDRIKIEEYITFSQNERQTHLDLEEDCIMIGGQSMYFKGLLAYFLNTTIPSGNKIHVCHACHNPLCSNPKHLYWGTPSENLKDAIANGDRKSIWEYSVDKYGMEGAKEVFKRNGNSNASGNRGKLKTKEHKKKISNAISNQICYTNGIDNIKQHKDLPVPIGYKRGMTRNKNKRPTG